MFTTSSSPSFNDIFLSSQLSPISTTNEIVLTDQLISMSPLTPVQFIVDFGKPKAIVYPSYESIDHLPHVRAKLTNYYYDIIRDKWLLDELNDILNYFKYENNKVRLIKGPSEYNPLTITKDTDKIAQEKVKYIEKNMLTYNDLTNLLGKFTQETGSKWVDLPKKEFILRQAISEYLMKKIKNTIRKK